MRAESADLDTFERIEKLSGDDRAPLVDAGPSPEQAERIAHSAAAASVLPPRAPIAAALPPRLGELLEGPPSAAEFRQAIGYTNPRARDLELKAEHAEQKLRALEQAKQLEATRAVIRAELGDWTKEERKRLEQMKPQSAAEEKDYVQLGKNVWAISRQAATGSARDLAYAISQMLTLAPIEAVGCWIVEAMGLHADGTALRQLYSPKARRKVVRSFVLWMCGKNDRLRYIAGSLSRRVVRGVKRCPQSLLARIAALGGLPWSRSTTTRDANESHDAGLYRRVRLPHALAHESERAGPSGQVVSRYWMELPRQPKPKSRFALPEALGGVFKAAGVDEDPLGWVREHAKNGIVYALRSVTTRRRCGELVHVAGMLAPLLHAPP
jgi:hypothetical protein